MSETNFTKLGALIDDEFIVEKVFYPKYKMWDNENRKMLVSDSWEKGYRKIYGVVTDKGTLDLSQGQLGGMLESVSMGGESKVVGRKFKVKSNGKSGMDIRYYINPVGKSTVEGGSWDRARDKFEAKKEEKEVKDVFDDGEPIDLSERPF